MSARNCSSVFAPRLACEHKPFALILMLAAYSSLGYSLERMDFTCRRVQVASDFAAIAMGALLWMGWNTLTRVQATQQIVQDSTVRDNRRIAENEIIRRIAVRDDAEREVDEIKAKSRTKAEDTRQKLAKQGADDRVNRKRLADLQSFALTYHNCEDLRGPLAEALFRIGNHSQASKDKDAAMAIFLEWHRRDPAGAMEALARRPAWFKIFESDYPMTFALEKPDILSQILNGENTTTFRSGLLESFAKQLAESDDLAGLSESFGQMDEVCRQYMLRRFVESWIPRDGEAAVRTIFDEMSPELRDALIDELRSGVDGPWTSQFTNAFFKRSFGDLEYMREDLKRHSESISPAYELSSESEEPIAEKSPIFSAKPPRDGVALMLLQDRDYPELFGEGKVGAEEIFQEMIRQIPAYANEPELVARAVFMALAPHRPEAAAAWAETRIVRDTLVHDTAELLAGLNDPRATRMVEVIHALPADLPAGKETSELAVSIRRDFKFWAAMDPVAAAKAAEEISGNHILGQAASSGVGGKEADP